MKYFLVCSLVFSTLIFTFCSKDDNGDLMTAVYEVTFTFNWNSQDFPTEYPSNAHFSKLIGWTHTPSSTFFLNNTMASEGIQGMSETGATSPLDNEISERIKNDEGLHLYIGNNLGSGTGTINLEITVDEVNSSVTLATMIAPSPDWYVAIVNQNLLENDGFIDSVLVAATLFDAGTDSGETFTSGNIATEPKQPISIITESPLGDGTSINPIFATVKIVKKDL